MRHAKEILATSSRALVALSKVLAWVGVIVAFWRRDWMAAQSILLLLIAMEVTRD